MSTIYECDECFADHGAPDKPLDSLGINLIGSAGWFVRLQIADRDAAAAHAVLEDHRVIEMRDGGKVELIA